MIFKHFYYLLLVSCSFYLINCTNKQQPNQTKPLTSGSLATLESCYTANSVKCLRDYNSSLATIETKNNTLTASLLLQFYNNFDKLDTSKTFILPNNIPFVGLGEKSNNTVTLGQPILTSLDSNFIILPQAEQEQFKQFLRFKELPEIEINPEDYKLIQNERKTRLKFLNQLYAIQYFENRNNWEICSSPKIDLIKQTAENKYEIQYSTGYKQFVAEYLFKNNTWTQTNNYLNATE